MGASVASYGVPNSTRPTGDSGPPVPEMPRGRLEVGQGPISDLAGGRGGASLSLWLKEFQMALGFTRLGRGTFGGGGGRFAAPGLGRRMASGGGGSGLDGWATFHAYWHDQVLCNPRGRLSSSIGLHLRHDVERLRHLRGTSLGCECGRGVGCGCHPLVARRGGPSDTLAHCCSVFIADGAQFPVCGGGAAMGALRSYIPVYCRFICGGSNVAGRPPKT